MTDTRDAVRALADTLADAFTPAIDLVADWRVRVHAFLAPHGPVTTARLDPLVEAFAVPQVTDAHGFIVGAGFVAAPGLLLDAAWHLAWWLSPEGPDPAPRRLATTSDPESDVFRDYTLLEWWRVPERTGRRHLTGPYVDVLCTDDYTITITDPVRRGDEVLGVVGVDLGVRRLERGLLPLLRAAGGTLTLVNEVGRTVISTDAHRPTGALVRRDGLADALRSGAPSCTLDNGARVVRCGETGLALLAEA